VTSPATGEPVTSQTSLNAFGIPFVDPGLGPRVTRGGKAYWKAGYPGFPGAFLPPHKQHKAHGGEGRPGHGSGHAGKGATPKPPHSPGGPHGGSPAPRPPSKTP
jgi:hypothetical protein